MVDVQRRRAPIAAQIVAVQNHLRLVLGLRAGESGIHVEILRPGVIGAELQAVAEAVRNVESAARCSCCCLRCTRRSRRPDTDWAACRTGMYCAPCGTVALAGRCRGVRRRPCSRPALAQICAGMVLGSTLSSPWYPKRADVGHAQRRVAVQLLLDREVPLLDRGRLGVGLDALRRVGGAGRAERRGRRRAAGGTPGCDRRDREQTSPEAIASRCRAAANSAGS